MRAAELDTAWIVDGEKLKRSTYMNRNDDLERTVVIKPAKKTLGAGIVPKAALLKSDGAPKSPEEGRKYLAGLASLYRALRG